MADFNESDVLRALNVLESLNVSCRWENICRLNQEQKQRYKSLLKVFEDLNGADENAEGAPKNLHNLKGKALEDLVRYLFQISGGIFQADCNLRTATNEIDDLITLTPKGKVLLKNRLIDAHLENFLGECKNYNGSVTVTYVGKFCSLMLTNNVKLGILFSFHGVSGTGWSNGSGLIKKFYLHKEKLEERYCVIDFSVKDFRSILTGKNLLQIIDEQLKSLQYDTDYSRFITKHPAEE